MDKFYEDKAWKLIAAPERWTQYASARTADGGMCDPCSNKAIKWCAWGALHKVHGLSDAINLLRAITLLTNCAIGDWNDDPARKHSEVVEFLKERDL